MFFNSLLTAIGNTPLVKVHKKNPADIYAKLEYLNPGGSLKDRPALYMIEKAEIDGDLKPGGTIIDASSGNYGISLAMVGALKGYSVIICVPDRTSKEKQDAIKAYGATIHICEDTADHDSPNGYHATAERLCKEVTNAFMPNQYLNPTNSEAHYFMTGPEIWKQTEGKITHFIAGAGTCGTICGVGRYLKEQNPQVKIIGIDSPNSFRSTGGHPKPYKIEGIGVDLDTKILDYSVIDLMLEVSDDEAFDMTRKLAHKGFLAGVSSGAVAAGAEKIEHEFTKDDLVVMIFGDSGRSYLTKNIF